MKFIGMPYKEFEDWQQQLTIKTSYKEFKSRLQELELRNIISDGELYEGIEDIWPDYPRHEDFFFNEDEY